MSLSCGQYSGAGGEPVHKARNADSSEQTFSTGKEAVAGLGPSAVWMALGGLAALARTHTCNPSALLGCLFWQGAKGCLYFMTTEISHYSVHPKGEKSPFIPSGEMRFLDTINGNVDLFKYFVK